MAFLGFKNWRCDLHVKSSLHVLDLNIDLYMCTYDIYIIYLYNIYMHNAVPEHVHVLIAHL